jgi:LacI family transcriptional regulator
MENKLPTITEIAKRLNISVSTVSRALHNHRSIGLRTKTRVQQLAAELNYEPNQTAIFFKQRKTFTIGVILPNLSESFFSSAISGIEDYTKKKKYNVLIGQSHDNQETEKQIVETMKNHRVDGILISVAKNTVSYEHFDMLKKFNIPIVFFDRIPQMEDIHYVSCRIEDGMAAAVNFLVKNKHRNIALINGPETLPASKYRLDAYMKTLQKNRIKIDPNFITSTNLDKESTEAAMQHLLSLKRQASAVITFNDYIALDAIQYAKKQKIKINKDISFVSFANLPICHYMDNPPLASVEQFPYKQGEMAAEILLSLLDKDEHSPASNEYKHVIIDAKLEVNN